MRVLPSIFAIVAALTMCAAGAAQSQPQDSKPRVPAKETEADAPESSGAPEPGWLDQALAREAEPMEERFLASDDGAFKTYVAAEVVAKPELVDGDYFMQLNPGTDGPMECWIYPGGHDVAASHLTLSDAAFQSIAENNQGEVELKLIKRIDAGVFGSHPFLALDWLGRIKTSRGPLAAQVKLLAAYKGGASVLCSHSEVGYGKTFERVFRGFVDRLELATADPEPYYREILVASLNNLKVGIGRLTLTLDEDGDTVAAESLAMLVPTGQGSLTAADTYNVQFSTPDGRLINKVEIESRDGKIQTKLRLDPASDGAWKVSGLWKSKEFEASLGPKELPSTLGQIFRLRDFLGTAKAGDQTALWTWSADEAPSTFSEIRVRVKGRTDDGIAAHMDFGSIEMDAILDDQASAKSVTFDMGGAELELRRVLVEGAVPAPPSADDSEGSSSP